MIAQQNYNDYISENIIPDKLTINLPRTNNMTLYKIVKIPIDVSIEQGTSYSRSVELTLTFDKYVRTKLFFTPIESSPLLIKTKLHAMVSSEVRKAYFEDGRADEIDALYKEKLDSIIIKVKKDV